MQKIQKGQKNSGPDKPNLFDLLKPYTGILVLMVLFTLIGSGANLVIPKIISYAIDSFQGGTFDLDAVLTLFISASLVIFAFSYLQAMMQTYLSERVARDLRKDFVDKLSRQSYSFVQKSNPSQLLTNLTSDMDGLKLYVSQAVPTIFSSVFIITGTAILLLTINWRLALPVIAMVPIIGGAFFFVLKKVRSYFLRARGVIDLINRVINESILGSALVRVVNGQALEYRKFSRASKEGMDLGIIILTFFATLIPVIMFIANLATLTILIFGGHLVILGNMTLGNFAAFNSYVSLLIFPIIMLGFMSGIIAQAAASYQRIDRILKSAVKEFGGTFAEPLKGEIEFKHIDVSFNGKPVLKNVSFRIHPGSRTAIIGPTAAGKSQLLNLLTALIQPDSGEILFDGVPLPDYQQERFHNQIGFVFQESVMFNLTLRENIAFNSTVTDSAMERALNTAELGEFVAALPLGLQTKVYERGTSLSGGQKQRIMLARALALEPKILLLDDFTARVDAVTEKRILANVKKNYPGITLISVTQKIPSVSDYEAIVLLMEGEVIAMGRHELLLKNCPEYIQIYNSQLSTSHYELQPE